MIRATAEKVLYLSSFIRLMEFVGYIHNACRVTRYGLFRRKTELMGVKKD